MRPLIYVALDLLMTIALVTTLGAQAPARDGARQGVPAPGAAGPRLPPRDPGAVTTQAVEGTATLRGQIVAADTGTPIRRAQVRVSSGSTRGARLATTDQSGRFEFRNLAAGRYTLSASKGGFVTLQYGQRRPGESGTPLEVADNQTIERLVVGLPRGSVISGRITDEFGEPVVNAGVSAMQYTYVNGRQRLQPAGARDTTDDQGTYRLFGLPPGDYIVSATLRTNEVTDAIEAPSGYAPTYYPGTPSAAEAQRVRLGLQQENSSVSFGLMATRLVRVSGQVMTSTGGAASGGMVTLSSDDGVSVVGAAARGATARIDGSGAFQLSNVAPGRYRLQARSGSRADGSFARMTIVVGGEDINGVTLVTAPAGKLSGVVVTDTGAPLPTGGTGVQVAARPASPDDVLPAGPGSRDQMRVGPDGWFEIGNVTEPRLMRVTVPSGWMLKSVRQNGTELVDVPIDVAPGQEISDLVLVITNRGASIGGSVFDVAGRPVLDATVIVFPADESRRTFLSRYIRSARPNQQGTFTITMLPPGEYLAAAVQGIEDGRTTDPELLDSLAAQATRVVVKETEQRTVDLRMRN